MSEAIRRARLRLEHARTHINDLATQIQAFVDLPPHELRIEKNPESGHQDIILKPVHDVPETLSFVVGDCIHDLRATLDNLISQLGLTYGYPLKTELSFPISPNTTAFNNRMAQLMRFPPDIRAEFQAVQPHDAAGRLNAHHVVWVLDKLWNMDKHRFPPLTNVVLGDLSIQYGQFSMPLSLDNIGAEISTAQGEIKLASIVGFRGIDPDTGERVVQTDANFEAHLNFGIRFRDMPFSSPAADIDVWRVVERSHWIVEKMVNRLDNIIIATSS